MTRFITIVATLAIGTAMAFASAGAGAQTAHPQVQHAQQGSVAAQDDGALTAGEIKKVDKDTGKLTIKHADLANLKMPAMTMSFKVRDQAMLDQVKAGDRVRFRAERVNGILAVTKLEAAH